MTRHTARRIALALLVTCGTVNVADALTLGVLANRPKPGMEARFRPLADYLSTQLKGVPIELEILDFGQMEQALAQHSLELVLTNPSSYLILRSQNSLSGVLTTMVNLHDGQATASLGGVIITQAARTDIATLTDLRRRRIAIPDETSLGGYQAQAFELLQAGVRLPRRAAQTVNGSSARKNGGPGVSGITLQAVGNYDAVVAAVLDGRAEVGFVRTGIIESLVAEGTLDPSRLRIVNRQPLAEFPYAVSTHLYPEWPLVALPHVDEHTVRRITAALLALEADHPAARAAGIAGFAPPADYLPVENLARTLRLPPYDQPSAINWGDVWHSYRPAIAALALLTAAIVGLLALLTARNRRLTHSEAALARAMAEQTAILSAVPHPMFELDADGCVLVSWAPSGKTTTLDPRQMVGKRVTEFLPAPASEQFMHGLREAGKCGLTSGRRFSLPTADGDRWFELSASPIVSNANPVRFAVLVRDITMRRKSEEQIKLSANVFTQATDGIAIADAAGTVVDVNEAYARITGYTRDELLGRNTRGFKSGYQGPGFYDQMWRELTQTGHWQGEVKNWRKSGEMYPAALKISAMHDEDGRTTHHVAVLTDLTDLKNKEHQLHHMAYHDVLTGLPNRALLADRLQQAMAHAGRHGKRVAVVYIDLDDFKKINDTHGHDQGDALLISVAHRMLDALREGDTLARIGGDEFVAVLADLHNDQDCSPLLERLLAAAIEPVPTPTEELCVSTSLGVTFFPQTQAIDADLLLRQADQALYQAKLAGKNRFYVYDASHDQAVRSRHESLDEIRQALAGGQFVLYYQPKVNLRTGAVVGAEALIRWQHPQRGLLAPAQFLPVIEDDALGVEVGEWVIDTALGQIEAWQQFGLELPVSVNVGARQLQQPDFTQRLRALLTAHPAMAPGALQVEVLESSALADIERVSQVMRACSELGVSFALDDFGTGYSTLLYLKHLPATTLKIDQTFVRHMLDDADNLAILDGVLTLARAFGRSAIAEGLETVEHGILLLQLGCEFGQGYGIARPMPAADLPTWAADWRPPQAWRDARRVSRDHLPLVLGDLEHRTWIRAITGWLQSQRTTQPLLATTDCRFGRWLDAEGRALHGASPAFRAVDHLHRQLHTLAGELAQLHAQGCPHEALARVGELTALQDAVRGQFGGLTRQLDEGLELPEVQALSASAGTVAFTLAGRR